LDLCLPDPEILGVLVILVVLVVLVVLLILVVLVILAVLGHQQDLETQQVQSDRLMVQVDLLDLVHLVVPEDWVLMDLVVLVHLAHHLDLAIPVDHFQIHRHYCRPAQLVPVDLVDVFLGNETEMDLRIVMNDMKKMMWTSTMNQKN
jgi:hypothetical protein